MKTVFITGASRGLGEAMSRYLLGKGFNVYGASRSAMIPEGLEENKNFFIGKINVSNEESCKNALADCIRKFGDIDILINNASGALGGKGLGEYNGQEIIDDISITLGGAINVTNAMIKVLRSSSLELSIQNKRKIVFISSSSGVLGEPGNANWSIYAAGKAGIIRFAECAGEDLKSQGISTNVIIPHNIRTSNYIEQEAISVSDVMSTLDFLIQENNNMNVKRLFIQPWQP
jgi:NAD(P)-dependent dehydrogenase (short-subunit alcohol dehydrogenase family)